MDKKRVMRNGGERKTCSIGVRVLPSLGLWLKKNKFSPTKIFEKACEDLGFKVDKK